MGDKKLIVNIYGSKMTQQFLEIVKLAYQKKAPKKWPERIGKTAQRYTGFMADLSSHLCSNYEESFLTNRRAPSVKSDR